MIVGNVFTDGSVSGYVVGDQITFLSQTGSGAWSANSTTGDITFVPAVGDECLIATGEFMIDSQCCSDIFVVTHFPNCTTVDCATWSASCVNQDPAFPYDCSIGPPTVTMDFTDDLVFGAMTTHQQNLLDIFTWLNNQPMDFSATPCEFTLEQDFPVNGNLTLKVNWSWTAPGPNGLIEICDSGGTITESIVLSDTCAAPFEADFRYSIDSIAVMSTTGSLNPTEVARLVINPAEANGFCN